MDLPVGPGPCNVQAGPWGMPTNEGLQTLPLSAHRGQRWPCGCEDHRILRLAVCTAGGHGGAAARKLCTVWAAAAGGATSPPMDGADRSPGALGLGHLVAELRNESPPVLPCAGI